MVQAHSITGCDSIKLTGMQTSDFYFDLPDELIAQSPLASRSDSRLLQLDVNSSVTHHVIRDLPALLQPGDLLVFNNTEVIPARLFGQKATGGKVEMLVERVLSDTRLLVKLKASKSPKPDSYVNFFGLNLRVTGRQQDLFELKATTEDLARHQVATIAQWLDNHGELPLPPYITRTPDESDLDRYQTIYASKKGAVAAPTAGLHFDQPLFDALNERGVKTTEITLHVGAGTYQPVRADDIQEHQMHAERVIVDEDTVSAVEATKRAGNRVIAVGTTSVRSLESAALATGYLQAYDGDTDIFIYPGKRFAVVDGLLTNFHLPESTLVMLVAAMAGTKQVLAAYQEAINERYRFFSYGDAMLVWPTNDEQ